jgi:hypothetical protein
MSDYDDLWGDIDESTMDKIPIDLLREQARNITERTRKILKGELETKTDEEIIYNTLYIVAPKLDNYRYALLKTASTSRPYPIFIYDNSQDENAIRVESPRKIIKNPFGMNSALLAFSQMESLIGSSVEYVGRTIPEPDFKAASYAEFESQIRKILSSKEAMSVIHSLLAQSKST